MNNILEEAKSIQNIIVKDRRYLHQCAEPGNNLPIKNGYSIGEDFLLNNHFFLFNCPFT